MNKLKHLIVKLLKKTKTLKILLIFLLNFHSRLYPLISRLAIYYNNGKHPKRDIIRYQDWFASNLKIDDVVIDIGSNDGMLANYLTNFCDFVYGIEINPGSFNVSSKSTNPKAKFFLGDATTFDFKNLKPINVIIMSNVLEHLSDRVGFLANILKQIHAHEKPSFRLLIRVPMIDRDWLVVYKKLMGVEWRSDPTHYTEYTLTSFKDELDQVGLKLSRFEIRFGELYANCII
jgi:hypothetical protein